MPAVRFCRAEQRGQVRAGGTLEAHDGLWIIPGDELRCGCGSTDLIAIRPGSDDTHSETGILITRGEPAKAWCAACLLVPA